MAEGRPAEAYLGVVDLFGSLLPGAVCVGALAYVFRTEAAAFARTTAGISEAAQWVAFGILAYVVGHALHAAASVMDEPLYVPYRNFRRPKSADQAYIAAQALRPQAAAATMNTFAWAKCYLLLRAPAALADVQRFEARRRSLSLRAQDRTDAACMRAVRADDACRSARVVTGSLLTVTTL